MRPVEKLPVGNTVRLRNGAVAHINDVYNPWRKAKPFLEANIGTICSYCEMAYATKRDLHVEHVQPKGLPKYDHLKYKWDNFLFSCATCNGSDNKDTKDVILNDVHLPHINNTFLSLKYLSGGVVMSNPALTGDSRQHSEALLSLVGLDKTPKTSSPGDERWLKRSEDWNLARKNLFKYKSGKIDVESIIDLVKARGGWSVWFTVFAGEDAVLSRLVNGNDFPGTCSRCFDSNNHYAPIERNPGATDPV